MATRVQHIILLLYQIDCLHSSAEKGNDEVWFQLEADGKSTDVYYNNPIKMDNSDERAMNLEIDCTYLQKLKVKIREKDSGSNEDDYLGEHDFYRGIALQGEVVVNQTTGKKKAQYKLYYRVLFKAVPTLRVHGLICHKQSTGYNEDLMDAVVQCSEVVFEECANVLKKSPRPSRKLMGKAFEKAGECIGYVAELTAFMIQAIEGKDDVYIQQILDSHDGSGGGFFPPPGGNGDPRTCHMTDDDEVYFNEGEWKAGPDAEYFRIALDDGTGNITKDTTIQLREHDKVGSDIPMGHLTINKKQYTELADQGAQVYLCDEYFRHQVNHGQGALYSLCYSVGQEDWAKPATEAAQGDTGEFPASTYALGFVVVQGDVTVGRFTGSELGKAVEKLNSLPNDTTRRAVLQLVGTKFGNPQLVVYDGHYQCDGLPHFNKYWKDWSDIEAMQEIASSQYAVVRGDSVIKTTYELAEAVECLKQQRMDVTRRAVYRVTSGGEPCDPTVLEFNGIVQEEGLPVWNKCWAMPGDIAQMNITVSRYFHSGGGGLPSLPDKPHLPGHPNIPGPSIPGYPPPTIPGYPPSIPGMPSFPGYPFP